MNKKQLIEEISLIENADDLRDIISVSMYTLRVVTGHEKEKCQCPQWTGVCLLHGCVRGSEQCSKCGGYRGFDDMD